ncbi:helix-turn-helix domain-containing protein [Actinotalea subterranea]|uniref:helix-turn-helix domain-containing protein n=1 Tax=Actinotalea subterranea TaxID=2607497 RepID=UPI0011EC1C25|nr:helix-turn-helix domain-containing protein [Actinotalea subterranea]
MSNIQHRESAPGLVTVAEVADELRVTQRFVRQLIARGDLRAVRVGARIVRVRHDDVLALLRPTGGAA